MSKKYCIGCNREVKGTKSKFNWIIFILGLLSLGVISVVYVLYYWLFKRKNKCSICGMKTISIKKAKKKGLFEVVEGDVNDGKE